jgi:hypothetical protein
MSISDLDFPDHAKGDSGSPPMEETATNTGNTGNTEDGYWGPVVRSSSASSERSPPDGGLPAGVPSISPNSIGLRYLMPAPLICR